MENKNPKNFRNIKTKAHLLRKEQLKLEEEGFIVKPCTDFDIKYLKSKGIKHGKKNNDYFSTEEDFKGNSFNIEIVSLNIEPESKIVFFLNSSRKEF